MARSASAIAGEKPATGAGARRTSSADRGASAASRRPVSATTSSIKSPISRRTNSCTSRSLIEPRIGGADFADDAARQRHGGDVIEGEQFGAQPVVDVVGVIGDVVGDRGDLRLDAGEAPQLQILQPRIIQDRRRHAVLAVAAERPAVAVGQRAIVLDQAFERFPGQVQAVEAGIAALERGHDAQRLRIMIEAAESREAVVERALAGMAERRMAEIVRERQRFGEIFVEAQPRASARATWVTSSVWVSRVR